MHPQDHLHEYVYEQGDTGAGDFLHFMNWLREVAPELTPNVYPVFKPKKLSPLQAADFVTWEQRFFACEHLRGRIPEVRESFAILMKLEKDWGVIDRPKLIEWCDWMEIPKRGASAPLSQRERARWRPAPLSKIKRLSAPRGRGAGH